MCGSTITKKLIKTDKTLNCLMDDRKKLLPFLEVLYLGKDRLFCLRRLYLVDLYGDIETFSVKNRRLQRIELRSERVGKSAQEEEVLVTQDGFLNKNRILRKKTDKIKKKHRIIVFNPKLFTNSTRLCAIF